MSASVRLLFVGQAPSRETDGRPPFVGKCGAFLASLMDTKQQQMLSEHDFLNVFDRWPGKGFGGDRFPMKEAQERALTMLDSLRRRTVVLLGSNVARAFGANNFAYFSGYRMYSPNNPQDLITDAMYVVPHPSGINRHWNLPENRLRAKKFFGWVTTPGGRLTVPGGPPDGPR